MSKNPNQYLIQNGTFVRNFNKLYKKIKDPWNQKKNFSNDLSIKCISEFVKEIKKKKKNLKVLDVGAGENYLKKHLLSDCDYQGTDIHNVKKKRYYF